MKENIVSLLYFLGIMGAILMYFIFPKDISSAIMYGAICLVVTIIPALLLSRTKKKKKPIYTYTDESFADFHPVQSDSLSMIEEVSNTTRKVSDSSLTAKRMYGRVLAYVADFEELNQAPLSSEGRTECVLFISTVMLLEYKSLYQVEEYRDFEVAYLDIMLSLVSQNATQKSKEEVYELVKRRLRFYTAEFHTLAENRFPLEFYSYFFYTPLRTRTQVCLDQNELIRFHGNLMSLTTKIKQSTKNEESFLGF
jgi:hypothetical protein